VEASNQFVDIADHWAKDDILFLVNKGVVTGVTPITFEPDRAITRAEFATMLVKALDLKNTSTGSGSFRDVAPGDWYYNAVEAAAQAGLISGVGEGRFEPNRTINRQEMAVLAVKARQRMLGVQSGLSPEETEQRLARFADAPNISPWARESAAMALTLGMVSSSPSGTFDPQGDATRAMAAAAIAKLLR
jgi:hypothetical protein